MHRDTLLSQPSHYSSGQRNQHFDLAAILNWAAISVMRAVVIFVVTSLGSQRMTKDIYVFGVYMISAVVCVVDFRVVIMMGRLRWHWITIVMY